MSSEDHAATTSQPKKKTYTPLASPTPEEMMAQDMMNNCAVQAIISGGVGAMFGVAFGLFTASLDNAQHGGLEAIPIEPQKPTRVVLKEMFNNMRTKSFSYAKGFGAMGLLFSGTECVIEKYRAKHDHYNAPAAGCVSGAILAHNGGIKAMCLGCVSFAAFNAAISYYLGHM